MTGSGEGATVSKACPVCKGTAVSESLTLYDDRYGYPGSFPVRRCGSCGHGRLDATFTEDQLTELYTRYYPRSMYRPDQHRPHGDESRFTLWLQGGFSQAYRWVPRGVKVLDIGCGFGETLGYHKSRGCDPFGVEADANVAGVAEAFGYNIRIGLFAPDVYEPESFDVVTMDQVIEHMTDPMATLSGVRRILKPGGSVVISTTNSGSWGRRLFGRRWLHWHAPYHLQHFTAGSMRRAAEMSGFSVETARTVSLPLWLHFQWNHLLAIPESGRPSPYWFPFGKKSFGWKIVALATYGMFHLTGFNLLLTKIGDALGVGDNLLFVLKKEAR